MSALPVLLAGERVRALVVGGGSVAARKTAALLDAGARVRVVAPEIGPALREAAAARPDVVRLAEREYAEGDVGDANLVVAATSSREVNARVARDAEANGRLASVADAPEEGAWTAMAVHRAGELVVGVSAGGVPGAAVRVRDALAERFDARYAMAVASLATPRRRLLGDGRGGDWRRASADLLDASFCDQVERGAFVGRLKRWMSEAACR